MLLYDFSDYKTFKELFRGLYYRKMTIDEAESKQEEVDAIILINIKKFYKGREKIIDGFKNEISLIYRDEEERARFEEEEKTYQKLKWSH